MNFQELLAFAERHPYLSLALIGLTLALIYTEIARLLRPYKALRPAQLVSMINTDGATVLDLSPSNDFEKLGHIAGSRSQQMSQFDPANVKAPKDKPIVLVCRTGQASGDAAKKLKQAGFEHVYWLDGGIGAWQQADLPLVKGRA